MNTTEEGTSLSYAFITCKQCLRIFTCCVYFFELLYNLEYENFVK